MPHIREHVKRFSQVFSLKDPVIEIGSYQVPDQRELANLRPLFQDMMYVGCDIRHGPGVDRLEDIQKLTFEDNSINTMLVLETLEHVANPFRAIAEMYRVLAPRGLLLISVPFYFPIHDFPGDYWRFTPQCLNLLFFQFHRLISWENAELSHQKARTMPRTIFVLASKQEFPLTLFNDILDYARNNGHHFLVPKKRSPQN